jgi:hypothetical protein
MSYQPIENYGFIGNMRTIALVGTAPLPADAPAKTKAPEWCKVDLLGRGTKS